MSSSDAIVEVPLPVRGLNSDGGAGPPGFAQELVNYIPGEPDRMRLRPGITSLVDTLPWPSSQLLQYTANGPEDIAPFLTAWNSDRVWPIGYAQFGDRFIIGFVGNDYGAADWAHPYPPGNYTPTTGLSAATRALYYDASTGDIAEVQPRTTVTNPLNQVRGYTFPPFGYSKMIGRFCVYQSMKLRGASRGGDLYAWGGAHPNHGVQNHPSGYATMSAGQNYFTTAAPDTALSQQYNRSHANYDPGLMLLPGTFNGIDQQYVYKIVLEDPNNPTTVFYLSDIYGKGGATPPAANPSPMYIGPIVRMLTVPQNIDTFGVFQDRLFTAGGTYSPNATGTLPASSRGRQEHTLIQFSEPGRPDVFPSLNRFNIDELDSPVTAMQTVGNVMLIHSVNKTFILSGYDQDNFSVRRFASVRGCVDPRATAELEGRVYWLSEDGLWSWSGSGSPILESHAAPGIGVTALMKSRLKVPAHEKGFRSPALGVSGSSILVTTPKPQSSSVLSAVGDQSAFDTQSRAWWNWNWSGPYPWLFLNPASTGQTLAVYPDKIADVTNVFREVTNTEDDGAQVSSLDFTSQGTWTQPNGSVLIGPLQPKRGHQVRIVGCEVDHHTTSGSPGGNGFRVFMVSDPDARASSGGTELGSSRVSHAANAASSGFMTTDRFSVGPTSTAPDAARFFFRVKTPVGRELIEHQLTSFYVRVQGDTREQRAQRGGY